MRARLVRRTAGDRRGGAIVEFAMIAPLLLTLVVGCIDFGYMFYVRQALEYATEQSGRYYMLNPSSAQSTVTGYLKGLLPGGSTGALASAVNISYADTASCNGNGSVTCTTITTTYVFQFAGYNPLGATTLRATTQAVRYN
jgi:Flp pilus assembly protein TadG